MINPGIDADQAPGRRPGASFLCAASTRGMRGSAQDLPTAQLKGVEPTIPAFP